MKLACTLVGLVALAAPSTAHADSFIDCNAGCAGIVAGLAVLEMVPPIMGTIDLFPQTHGRAWATTELVIGSAMTLFNSYLAYELDFSPGFDTGTVLFGAMVASDIAVAIHGGIKLSRGTEAPPPPVRRAALVPTMVPTQTGVSPAIGLVGTF